jgi:hypothetical protein
MASWNSPGNHFFSVFILHTFSSFPLSFYTFRTYFLPSPLRWNSKSKLHPYRSDSAVTKAELPPALVRENCVSMATVSECHRTHTPTQPITDVSDFIHVCLWVSECVCVCVFRKCFIIIDLLFCLRGCIPLRRAVGFGGNIVLSQDPYCKEHLKMADINPFHLLENKPVCAVIS